jgi:hypothetical protein
MRFATGRGASSEEAGWGGGVSGPGADCANAAVAQTRPAPVIRIVLPIDHMVTPQTQARLLSTKTFATAPRWVPGANLFCPTLVIRAGAKGLLAPLPSVASPNRCSHCGQAAGANKPQARRPALPQCGALTQANAPSLVRVPIASRRLVPGIPWPSSGNRTRSWAEWP